MGLCEINDGHTDTSRVAPVRGDQGRTWDVRSALIQTATCRPFLLNAFFEYFHCSCYRLKVGRLVLEVMLNRLSVDTRSRVKADKVAQRTMIRLIR